MKKFQIEGLSILHVATARTWRGGEQQVTYLIEELASKGVRQYVLCTRNGAMEEYCRKNKIPYFSAGKRSSLDFSYALRLKKICRSLPVNIVHAHDSHALTFAVSIQFSFLTG